MKKLAIAMLLTLLIGSKSAVAQEIPEMPMPQKEHVWLNQFVGEWDTKGEFFIEPGQDPIISSGTEVTRSLGGFWVVAESDSDIMGMPFSGVLTLGFDSKKNKYVGTWVDSMSNYLWKYEGTVDATGKILTLDTEGPCPNAPGKISKFKEVTEFKSPDLRVFTSNMQEDDGKWTKNITVTSRRKGSTAK